ncbi:lysophosphatidylcholine acyltransferase 1 isoform X1 [Thrips palmi]|uniref:Lysophosphatidylcholine acyltransferase 1 isoform X1 n=1 Tax=Thrips palmi TaxID=161013 RepID=A0A6P8ZVS6_THRPL|nr:lysophosphatidylcholine acyltransferase 1 isoform X1 [Thrips palmi]
MNENMHPGDDLSTELINPFVHRLEFASTYEKIKTALLTVTVLPLRVLAIAVLLVLAWLLACVGLIGLSEEDLRTKPMTGWRKDTKSALCFLMRGLFAVGGFHRVRVKGRQAAAKEAPVLAVAPHSSYFDALPVVCLGGPSVVAKGETGYLPFFGKLINYTQPVYVWREDPLSRQKSIKEIVQRATSAADWPQVLIFPEGTCTNRSCLITFKHGAFYPGVPVQPVCIRYPNKLDTVTWTWEGPGALKLLWMTLTQPHSSCEIEFLPVYRPSEEEKKNPKLYAQNVRRIMARALDVPVSDYTYNDCRLLSRVKQMRLARTANLLEVHKLRAKLGLNESCAEERLLTERPHGPNALDWSAVTLVQFADCLCVDAKDPATLHLFQLYEKDGAGVVDLREYLLGVLAVSKATTSLEMVQLAFQIYDRTGVGRLGVQEVAEALHNAVALSWEDAYDTFRHVDVDGKGQITFAEFESYARGRSEFSYLFPHDRHQTQCSSVKSKDSKDSKEQ